MGILGTISITTNHPQKKYILYALKAMLEQQ